MPLSIGRLMTPSFYTQADVVPHILLIQPLLGHASQVRPDLSRVRKVDLGLIILALIHRGYRTEGAVLDYLTDHGFSITRQQMARTIAYYSTTMEVEEGEFDGLWHISPDGTLVSNFEIDDDELPL